MALIGGAGTGGYYAGKDKREFSSTMDDDAITTSINSKFLGAKGVSTFDINVDTYNRIVTHSEKTKYKVISKLKTRK